MLVASCRENYSKKVTYSTDIANEKFALVQIAMPLPAIATLYVSPAPVLHRLERVLCHLL